MSADPSPFAQRKTGVPDCHMPTRHTHSFSFLLESVKFLLLEGSWLAEGENDGMGGQLGVGVSHGVKTFADG